MHSNRSSKWKPPEVLGLAFSGGGARGAYQYGVWRILQASGMAEQIRVIGGTSIGAVNALLFLQEQVTGDGVARLFWEENDLSSIFNVMPVGRKELLPRDYLRLGLDGITHLGIRIDPFKAWLRNHLRPEVLLEHPYIVWANSWDMFRFREHTSRFPGTDPQMFIEWVLGSASFPFFGPHQHAGKFLLDGGISNNLPLHLVFRENVDRVLAIDLATFMRLHPRQIMLERKYQHKTHVLRASLRHPSPAHFSRSSIDKLIALGKSDAKAWLGI